MGKLVECIPNFSEGRDENIVNQIVKEIVSVSEVKLTDKQMNADHNRAVITFVGPPDACKQAAFNACKKAMELIDMRKHTGEHPRIGATDVIPFVPISEVTMEECVELARSLAKEIAEKLNIPTYLYEEAATTPERRDLAYIRRGEYEVLREAIKTDPTRKPDFGPCELHPTAGATIVGAREYLIAYNVNLGTNNLSIAKNIAKAIRYKTGGLKNIKALGFEIKERNIVQVSMNMTNYQETPLFRAFEFIKREAERYGVPVIGSEIVGVTPLKALVDVAEWYLRLENFSEEQILEKKIWGEGYYPEIEGKYLQKKFISALASGAPTPGGGVVASLSGAFGSALVSMVCNLTIGKEKFKDVEIEMKEVLKKATKLCEEFLSLAESDEKAFSKVISAYKLPKNTEEEKEKRNNEIELALVNATNVPLNVMEKARDGIELSKIVIKKGNPNALSDAAISAIQFQSTSWSALFNVFINLPGIKNEEFKLKAENKAKSLQNEIDKIATEIKLEFMERLSVKK